VDAEVSGGEPDFVGESRRLFVDGLIAIFDEVNKTSRPRWISLEAPPGWGKTRVAREFYARLARERQRKPPYWPQAILPLRAGAPEDLETRRKRVFPQFDHAPGSLPDFAWWGIACSTRNGVASVALAQDLAQFMAHADYLDDAWRKLASVRQRGRRLIAGPSREAAGEAAKEGGPEIAKAALEFGGLSVPFLGFSVWIGERAWSSARSVQKRRSRLSGAGQIGGIDAHLVNDAPVMISRLGRPGLPVVVFVEDFQAADPVLVELLTKLMRSSAAVLIITSGWPGHVSDNLQQAMDAHAGA